MISKILSAKRIKKGKLLSKLLSLIKNIVFSAFFAFLFSLPIYINTLSYYYDEFMPYSSYINSLAALIAIFVYINIHKKFRFFFGFFVGILWFYWVGLSFRFTTIMYFGYIASISIAIVYGIIFVFLLFFQNKLFRIFTISIIGSISILGFNWFVPDVILALSIFRVDKISFILICIIIAIISIKSLKKARFLALIPLILLIDIKYGDIQIPINFELTQTDLGQKHKWNNFPEVIQYNLSLIKDAISNGYEAIVLPETAFPFILNKDIPTLETLKNLSHKIIIVTGGIRENDNKFYNTTYVFENGNFSYADKVFLAPFGEYVPLPHIFVDIFNHLAKVKYDVNLKTTSIKPNNIKIKGITFRNAICYEATSRQVYEDNPKFMMVIANNAWFYPSIEPLLQAMLMKYYARLHDTTIFASENGSTSGIITPYTSLKPISYIYNRLK